MYARILHLVLAIIALGVIGLGLKYARDDARELDRESAQASSSSMTSASQGSNPAALVEQAQEESIDEALPLTPRDVARLIADTNSGDAHTRSSAIVALVNAPKSEAVPALQRIVEGGEPTVDRPLALQSLRDLALHQGDEDGAIRNVVRETIYHSDDDALVGHAQLALEIIEESAMGQATK